ncbi:MAG: hypothetical protein LBJ76_00970, partial [Candidatus Accumulibacter sp.]|nr:hypothetical protein [Accumulibacter sp.]
RADLPVGDVDRVFQRNPIDFGRKIETWHGILLLANAAHPADTKRIMIGFFADDFNETPPFIPRAARPGS